MHCVKPQDFFQISFEKIRQSEVSLGGLLSRPEVGSSLYVNSENATFIQKETFSSYSEYFVESLRYGYRMIYGKYLLANNRLRLKVAFLLQAVVL